MKRVLWLFAACAVVAAQPTAAPGGSPAPGVRVTGYQPFTVHGSRFRAGERVRVVLVLGGRHTRSVRAGRGGSFVARFNEDADRCTAYTLRVLNGQTVRAAVRHRPPRSCAALDPVG